LGENIYDWFLPIHRSPGDGIRFEYNEALVRKLKARARVILRDHEGARPENNKPILPGVRTEYSAQNPDGSD
jgi:hypothetical protein